ncbi:MAG TPA: glycosyltransferase [Clostridium sp.]|uniref:glycosyltransferase n=1 Tax=Clostridium sp. TaxID=1506 RepID=UPI002F9406BF
MKNNIIVQVGPYPQPIGGVSIYIKRMRLYMDLVGLANEVWDLSNINKNIGGVTNIRLRYVPFKYLFRKNIKLIHYNIPGISYKIYIGFFNRLLFKRRKKILTIHGASKDLFTHKGLLVCKYLLNNKNLPINYDIIMAKSLNSFDAIICVKPGDKKYLFTKGINKPIYEVPAFIFPIENEESLTIPKYIVDFINSKNFIICANASLIQFYDNQDLYGIDMCIDLIEKLNANRKNVGLVFCLPYINNTLYFNKLKNIIKSKKIESNFLFVNEKMELYPIIKKSQLFVRPTNTDGDAVSIREALFYKIPTVASDICTRPQGTILFKSRNIDDLYNKTVDVIENYEKAKEKLKDIKVEDNARKLLKIYEECLKQLIIYD